MQNKKLRFLAASKCSTLFRYCETSNVESIKKESLGRMPVLTNELEITSRVYSQECNFLV